jgi:WD40 repeat protein
MQGHSSTIRCLYFGAAQNMVISGSEDKTVKLWSFDTGTLTKTLREHSGEVTWYEAIR